MEQLPRHGKKQDLSIPEEPLHLIKTANSFLPSGGIIVRPPSYGGKVVYEGELGIVIGKTCSGVPGDRADDHIFGCTCINDVTAIEIINNDPSFPQWSRAKSMDTFGVFGPVVAAGIDPSGLSIRTVLNGYERQNYPVRDMIHPPRRIVSSIQGFDAVSGRCHRLRHVGGRGLHEGDPQTNQ